MTHTHRSRLWDAIVPIAAIAIGLVIIFPVLYCIFTAFKTPAELASGGLLPEDFTYLENFRNALRQAPLLRYMYNSLITALFGTLIRLVIAVLAAYVLTYYEFRGKRLFFVLILGTMMIPGDTILMTNYQTVSRLGLLNTYLGMVIVSFVGASQMFALRQKFLSVPRELQYAAMMDGCGDFRYIVTILLPTCKSVLAALFAQSFLTLWNAYLWPLIVTASAPDLRTVMVGITKLNSWEDSNYELVLAGVTISLLPSLLLFLLLRRSMHREVTDGVLVG